MDRKNFLLRRRLQYIGILFLVFVLLLGIFDFIVYAFAENALYEEIDSQMADAEAHIQANEDGALDNFLNGRNIIYYDDGQSYVVTYRIFLLLRSTECSALR